MIKLKEEIIKEYKESFSKLDSHVKSLIKEGDTVEWTEGPYKGRKAVVRYVFWDYEPWLKKNPVGIKVTVKTERADKKGYIDDNDLFHRSFRNPEEGFKMVKRK